MRNRFKERKPVGCINSSVFSLNIMYFIKKYLHQDWIVDLNI